MRNKRKYKRMSIFSTQNRVLKQNDLIVLQSR